ncbi:MAG: aminopeptidase [Candidatus Binatia bacterium]
MVVLGILGSLISGCSPLYVIRAAYEEGKILWRREPITAYLAKPDLGADTEDKLKLVLAVREYASDVLKLNVGGSYSSYSYVDRADLTYLLTAAPRTDLRPYTWWFLIVGRVPYKGYFSREEAQAAADELQSEGYDTNIRTSAAFSTLGWFNDPLLAHLLKYDRVTLADVVFHELFHNTLYVKGAGAFNESMANFVGARGAIQFFGEKFGEASPEHRRAVRDWQEELEFSEFIQSLGASLTELYAKDIPYEDKLRLREEVFARGKKDWEERIADRPSHRFRGFAKQPLNNAVLIHYLLYLKNLQLFELLYQQHGKNLVRLIESVRLEVEKGGEPFERVQALLMQQRSRFNVQGSKLGLPLRGS